MTVQLHLGDCLEFMRTLPDNSVDAVVTDPPYGMGIAEWDSVSGGLVFLFASECFRVSRQFVSIFAQMPYLCAWHDAMIDCGWQYREHITWVKRKAVPATRLSRTHEEILIYGKPGTAKFHETRGPFEDVKLPGVLVDTVTLEGIDRHIKDLRAKVGGGSSRIHITDKRQPLFSRFCSGMDSDRSPATCNFTNVWSFLPPSMAKLDGEYLHPCEKPVELMARLIEMLSASGATVFDPFTGSGTTGVACVQTGRSFIGCEIDEGYFNIAKRRIEQAQMQPALEGIGG